MFRHCVPRHGSVFRDLRHVSAIPEYQQSGFLQLLLVSVKRFRLKRA
jgi:hypothetical protein